jgi:hypothetical protein
LRGLAVRLQLFTVPGQVYYNATRRLVLTGADGIVMVVDSQRARADANVESLANLQDNLVEHGRALNETPHIFQYNKRDLPDLLEIEELEQKLNHFEAPSFATVATNGEGIYEALEGVTRAVLEDFERRMPESREFSAKALRLPEGGLTEALRGAGSPVTPQPAEVVAHDEPPVSEMRDSGTRTATPVLDVETATSSLVGEGSRPDSVIIGEGFSFAAIWPAPMRGVVHELEACVLTGDYTRAVMLSEELVSRTLSGAAVLLGGSADRDPATMALLLGLDGRRYLEFRSLVRDARQARLGQPEALAAFAVAIDVRLLASRVGA